MSQTVTKTKIGRVPVVVLPMKEWKMIEESLEDLEMYKSKALRKSIAKARSEVKNGKVFDIEEVEKKLGVR